MYCIIQKDCNQDKSRRRRSVPLKSPIVLEKDSIGEGGEGSIYNIVGRGFLVAKIYHDKDRFSLLRKKIDCLRNIFFNNDISKNFKEKVKKQLTICTPLSTIFNDEGDPVGYTMRKAKGETLYDILNRESLEEQLHWTRLDLCDLSLSMLDLFDVLHKSGVLMADINLNNIMACVSSGNKTNTIHIWFIDVDSYQIGGIGDYPPQYPCTVGRYEFVPEHLIGANFGNGRIYRTYDDELFALATLMFAVFIPGNMPWARQDEGNVENLIRHRIFSFPDGYRDNGTVHVGLEILWHQLPEAIREAFCNAFQRNKYATTEQWRRLISNYRVMILNGQKRADIYPPNPPIQIKRRVRTLEPEPMILTETNPDFGWNTLGVWNGNKNYHLPITLEMGASGLKLTALQVGFEGNAPENLSSWKNSHPVPFFSMLEKNGYLPPSRLQSAFSDTKTRAFFTFLKKLRAQRPCYTTLHAFGLSFLRNLSNRSEIVEALKDLTGYEFRTYTAEEEALMHMRVLGSCGAAPRLLLHLSSSSLVLALNLPGQKLVVEELTSLGKEVLINWFFDSHLPQSDLATALDEHDEEITKHLSPILENIKFRLSKIQKTDPLSVILLGFGIAEGKFPSYEPIEEALKYFDKKIKTNRHSLIEVEQEINDPRGDNIRKQLLMRLVLPIPMSVQNFFCDSTLKKYDSSAFLADTIIHDHYA